MGRPLTIGGDLLTIDLSREELKVIAQKLGINQPILAHKVVGSRVELRLLGGSTAVYTKEDAVDILQLLANLSVKELKTLASLFNIQGIGGGNFPRQIKDPFEIGSGNCIFR